MKTPKDTPITNTPQSCPDCGCTLFESGNQSLHCYEIDFDCGFSALMLFSHESGMVYKECKANKTLKYLGCVTAQSVDAKPVTAQQIIEAADKSRERSANRERKTRVIRRIE